MVPKECSIFNFKINYFKLFFPAALSTADGWPISVSTNMWLSFENSPVAFPLCWSILLHEEKILLTKISNVFQFDDCNTKRGNPRYFPINQTRTRIFGFIFDTITFWRCQQKIVHYCISRCLLYKMVLCPWFKNKVKRCLNLGKV